MKFVSDTLPTPKYNDNQIRCIEENLDKLVATIKKPVKCAGGCGRRLDLDCANIYDHVFGGWWLTFIPKQWVSFRCSCGYETSLDKLGVPR